MKFFRLTYFLLWILIFHLSSPIHHRYSRRHHLHHLYQQGCPLLSAGFQVTAIQHYVEHTLHSKQSKNVKTGDFPAAPQVGSPRREKNFDTAPFSTKRQSVVTVLISKMNLVQPHHVLRFQTTEKGHCARMP